MLPEIAQSASSGFLVEHGAWVALLGTVVILGLFLAYQRRGALARRGAFSNRRTTSEIDWFESYYPVDSAYRGAIKEMLEAFGKEIGVRWTRLRPSDTFENEIRIAPC